MLATAHTTDVSISASRAMFARGSTRRPLSLHGAGHEIYAQGEASGTIFRIEFGAVRIYRLLSDGRRQVVAFHISGETFGFEGGRTHSFFAETLTATGLTTVALGPDKTYSPELMELALRNMVRAQEHLLVVGRQSALEKIAVFLLDLAERQGDGECLDLPMSRTDIGDYLGMTIETVSRSISKLRDLGIVRMISSRKVEILSEAKLARIAG